MLMIESGVNSTVGEFLKQGGRVSAKGNSF